MAAPVSGPAGPTDPLEYRVLAETMEELESTSGRLKMQDILVELYLRAPPSDARNVTYLLLGTLGPKYSTPQLGVSDKLVLRALSRRKGIPESELALELARVGDIGTLVMDALNRKRQRSLTSFSEDSGTGPGSLTVEEVHSSLLKMALKKEKDSQALKLDILNGLFQRTSPLEAKYITRFVTQRMRLGVKDLSLVEALSFAYCDGWDTDPLEEAFSGFERMAGLDGFTSEAITLLKARAPSSLNLVEDTMRELMKAMKHSGALDGSTSTLKLTITEAISTLRACAGEARVGIEGAYNAYPNLGEIAELLAKGGLVAMSEVDVTPFTPLKAMLAERLRSINEIMSRLGRCALEYKYDGLRMQVHCSNGKVRLFSRGLEELTDQFPDIVESVGERLLVGSVIADGECVPIHPDSGDMLPFQVISRRRGRKVGLATDGPSTTLDDHSSSTFEEEYPVVLVLFDCLYLDGRSMLHEPYPVRRDLITRAFGIDDTIRISDRTVTDSVAGAERFFDRAISEGCEGVVAKSIGSDSIYRAGARGFGWIKYKRDYRQDLADSLDLVVMGAFWGKGKRHGVYGAFLMGSLDPGTGMFRTVCKLGTGFTDEMLATFRSELDRHTSVEMPREYDVARGMIPDVWFDPVIVWEVVGAEISFSPIHTCAYSSLKEGAGLAIRFPRFSRTRDDKDALSSTTSSEMISLYNGQGKRVSHQ